MEGETDELVLRFHGRIIDSLGIQMYQSPVAAVAELIANAWDADAADVKVELPENVSGESAIIVRDNGFGMTFAECRDLYLNVGRDRRIDGKTDTSPNGRPLLGRKGIGKFAGFGIAERLEIDTISAATGERTAFCLNLSDLRSDSYVGTDAKRIPVLRRDAACEGRKSRAGTKVTLKCLTVERAPSQSVFLKSMARRFLIAEAADTFRIRINGEDLPDDNALAGVEFDFPGDYKDGERPPGLRIKDKTGLESVGGEEIAWRFRFTKEPIDTEELRGISVFCGIKLAQAPFFFNLSGGLSGQHGQQYVSGQVRADFLDRLNRDVITTERQRINWELAECRELETWGRDRIKSLLSLWKVRRADEKLRRISEMVQPFAQRLARLAPSERKTVETAMKKVAAIETLSAEQFEDLSGGILTAWEGGRLKQLIRDISSVEEMDERVLLSVLAEAQVLGALHVAEAVKAKLDIIDGLRRRIKGREMENTVRDYIAVNPWLLSPEWETFRVETSVRSLIADAAAGAKLDRDDEAGRKRVDLALSSGTHLLVVEFMRPGLTADIDHLTRFQHYLYAVRERVGSNTAQGFKNISGLLVADRLGGQAGAAGMLKDMAEKDLRAIEWDGLLCQAEAQWREFLTALADRAPDDMRLAELQEN